MVDEDTAQAEGSESVEAVHPAASRGRWGGLHFLAAGVATLSVGAVTMLLLIRHPEASDSTATFVEPSDPPTHDVSPAPPPTRREDESPSAPKWIGNRQPQRASDGSRTVAFQLQATHSVPVWGRSVRPILGVRCLWGETEVFVITRWAASVEPEIEGHSVGVAFNEGSATVERWSDSVDKQALFAPDGVVLVRQIAGSHTMRFGFTPYNASPVVVEFDVRGFDKLIGSVARVCGWTP